MADLKISQLPQKTKMNPSDLLALVDESGTPTTKRILLSDLLGGIYPSFLKSSWSSTIGAWIYPDVASSQAANAPTEYANNTIDTLKPQYFVFNGSGVLTEMDASLTAYAANGYSSAHWTDVVNHSTHQYITVAGGEGDLAALTGTTLTNAQNTLETFVTSTLSPNPTGIELDIEGYGTWTSTDWSHFNTFIQNLGTYLHAHSMKLMVDWQAMGGPTASYDINPFDSNTEYHSYANATYSNLATLISGGYLDYVCVLAYDEQYNFGVGTPIAPLRWIKNAIAYAQFYIPLANLVVGLPSYGYYGNIYTGTPTSPNSPALNYGPTGNVAYNTMSGRTGFANATRDLESFEMQFFNVSSSKTVLNNYNDQYSMAVKRALIESMGVTRIDVWSLGGNPWFPF